MSISIIVATKKSGKVLGARNGLAIASAQVALSEADGACKSSSFSMPV